jgi:tetraacyldisaccharide 4'-kinase
LVAVAGIAKPGQFFDMLSAMGLSLSAQLGASDHASAQELMALLQDELSSTEGPVTVLCTEKDASKLWSVFPQAWSVALEVRLDPLFLEEFDLAWRHRISSTHGHETH